MEDTEVYGWRVARDFHAAWLQQMEQGRAAWWDDTKTDKLRRLLVWSRIQTTPKHHCNCSLTIQGLGKQGKKWPL